MIIPSSLGALLVNAYLNLGASFDRFVIILFGIGMLYVIGQLLTHFSYDVIMRPLQRLASWRNDKQFAKSDIEWMADHTFIRHKDAALGLEISKRYARKIMSRNNALVTLLLMITSLISGQWIELTISGIFFLLFVHEAYGKQRFFSGYLQEVTKELRNMEQNNTEEYEILRSGGDHFVDEQLRSPRAHTLVLPLRFGDYPGTCLIPPSEG